MRLTALVFCVALLGCTPETRGLARDVGVPALKAVAKAAAPELRKMAQKKGIEINEAGAMCIPVSDVLEESLDVELPGVALMCIAPEL